MKNLDVFAAETAQVIIAETKTYTKRDKRGNESEVSLKGGEVDNLITKALGVLQENGVYAALLYLYSRTSDNDVAVAKKTREQLLHLLSKLDLSQPVTTNAADALAFLTTEVCNDLDTLLLVKQLWEQTLIYTRYGAKARSAAEE